MSRAAIRRAIREAQRILEDFQPLKSSVPLKQIAMKYARLEGELLPTDISGMLIPLDPAVNEKPWVIVYNIRHVPQRQRFTIAHELGHLLLHNYKTAHADSGFKLRYRDAASSTGEVIEEIEANAFAAELLMPAKLVLTEANKIGFDFAMQHDRDLSRLARKFQVSKLALGIRLAQLIGTSH